MEANYSQDLQAEPQLVPRPGVLLTNVHRIYHQQFGRWFAIMAPTSILAGIVLVLADQRIRAIFNSIPRGELTSHFIDVLAAGAIRISGFFLSWLLGAFALAAIATVVNELDAKEDAKNWDPDSYQLAREHLGSIIRIAIITFCVFLLGLVGLGFVESAAFRIFGRVRLAPHTYMFGVVGYVIIASVVGLLGAAIPLAVRGDLKIFAALKRSVELSSGYEGALLLLVIESVAGSFIAWYAVVHGLPLLLPSSLTYSGSYVWILNIIGLLASACVESPLFIGFSLLAEPERFQVMCAG